MKVLALDLEMNQPSGRIIQIGAVIGDLSDGCVEDTFCVYVNPGEPIDSFIQELTGVTQAHADSGMSLRHAYDRLLEFRAGRVDDKFPWPLTWGGGDSQYLKQELKMVGADISEFPFGRRWFDVKTLFQAYAIANGVKLQAGQKRAMGRCGIMFTGRAHDAAVDAYNTFRFAHWLISKMKCDALQGVRG
jgi:inhibitor of KinA sporulation pathway (predicted exonuclease)